MLFPIAITHSNGKFWLEVLEESLRRRRRTTEETKRKDHFNGVINILAGKVAEKKGIVELHRISLRFRRLFDLVFFRCYGCTTEYSQHHVHSTRLSSVRDCKLRRKLSLCRKKRHPKHDRPILRMRVHGLLRGRIDLCEKSGKNVSLA